MAMPLPVPPVPVPVPVPLPRVLPPAPVPALVPAAKPYANCPQVGCGGGIASAALAGLGYHVTGVDPSAPSLEEARAHARRLSLQDRLVFLEGSAYDLSMFPPASFDGVVMADVLEHLLDLPSAVQQARAAHALYVCTACALYMCTACALTRCGVSCGRAEYWSSTRSTAPTSRTYSPSS